MSETSTPVTAEHFRYLAERTVPEDAFLCQLKDAARAAGLPAIWISPEQGSFVQILLKLCRAREVVEVGTLAGYSAIWMARALPAGGRVRTIEINPAYADVAERWVSASDVADRIEIVRGNAVEVLPAFTPDSADAMFADADKVNNATYLREALRVVRKGGLIMFDNAFAFGQLFAPVPTESGVREMRAFNDHLASVAGVHGIIVPLGDGLWVAVKN
ncbi:MAG: O-methyltransferase [Planctomycetes bacterium]|nr:O-methyltransferase [Planctomycetota bacterium]